MKYRKPPEEELYISFKSYEQLHYTENLPLTDSVKVFCNNRKEAAARIWYDAEMEDRPYIIINNTIEYLDSLHTLTPIKEVIYRVCHAYSTSKADIDSYNNSTIKSEPRHILFYILRIHYGMDLLDIADMFNRKAHATVINGIKRIQNTIDIKPDYKKHVHSFFEKQYRSDTERSKN